MSGFGAGNPPDIVFKFPGNVWAMILVVGGAGFIGSHMVKALRAAGKDTLVFDNFERGHEQALLGCPYFRGDLRDKEAVQQVFRDHPIDLVYHFAAYIEVGESVENPAGFYQNNVLGTYNLLETMRQADVSNIVFSSTAAVYGEPESVPIGEDHPKNPTSPYGDTKLAVERMLGAYDRAYGMKSVCLRYFNAAGSDPDCQIGEEHEPETHLVPRLLLSFQGRANFTVFGDDYDTPDGTCVRDYVHVSDLADAHLRAADYLQSGGSSTAFNLGNGNGYSVNEVVRAAQRVTGISMQPEIGPRRAGDPARLVASNQRAKEILGWEPRYPEIETMVAHTWAWQSSHPRGYGD